MADASRRRWMAATVLVAASLVSVLSTDLGVAAGASVSGSCDLIVGTAGIPGVALPGTTGFAQLAPAPPSASLPKRVVLRDTTTTYNHRWAFTLWQGWVYAEPLGSVNQWRQLSLPTCLAGHITAISADDALLMAVAFGNRVYTMDQALSAPILWNWTSRWGPPLWIGSNSTYLPPNTLAWSASLLSGPDDRTWTDGAGNAQPIGGGNVTNVFALTGDGSHIVFLDPWLPVDWSYQVEAPLNGRFRSISMSASASTLFVINKYGDMYTRLYDFDMSGADTTFFRYSYESQRGRTPSPIWETQFLDTQYAAFQLPAVGWVHQPKIPGQITSHISIQTTGAGSAARELRAEGMRSGVAGYWHKLIGARTWTFTATGLPLSRPLIANPATDRSAATLAPISGLAYAGRTLAYGAKVADFTSATQRSGLVLTFADGSHLSLVLYTVDGLRQSARGAGIDANPRAYDGELEVPSAILADLAAQPASVRRFIQGQLGGRRFTSTSVLVTAHSFGIAALSLNLAR